MRYIVHVPAGSTVRQPFSGQNLVLADAGAAGAVTIGLIGASSQDVDTLGEVGKGFALFLPDRKFSGVELSASVDTVAELIVTDYRVTITDGQSLTATIDATQLPLPVQNQQGDGPGNPLFVSGAVLGDTPAATITDLATAAATDVAALVLAADATRLEAVFYNQGPDAVALGMVGITWAKRAIVLEVGESWVESRAAAKAWYAITAATKTATLGMQERKA